MKIAKGNNFGHLPAVREFRVRFRSLCAILSVTWPLTAMGRVKKHAGQILTGNVDPLHEFGKFNFPAGKAFAKRLRDLGPSQMKRAME